MITMSSQKMLSKPPFFVVNRRLVYLFFKVGSFCSKIITVFVQQCHILCHLLLSTHTIFNHKLFQIFQVNPNNRGNFVFTLFQFIDLLFFKSHQASVVHIEGAIYVSGQLTQPEDSFECCFQTDLFKHFSLGTLLNALRGVCSSSGNSELSFESSLKIFQTLHFSFPPA